MSKQPRRKIVRYEEDDAYTYYRRFLCYLQRAGAVKEIKRRTHRRERREGQTEIRTQLDES